MQNTATCTRADAQAYFDNTWALTEVLFSGLQGEEAFYRPPYHGLRHPMIFYYGHVATLYVNKLRLAGAIPGGINEYFEKIFEVGVDEMSWDDMGKNEMLWPAVSEVTQVRHLLNFRDEPSDSSLCYFSPLQYRRKAYALVSHVIATHPCFDAPGEQRGMENHALWALAMGFEHERIHIETSSVLLREMPVHLLHQPMQWPMPHPAALDAAAAVSKPPENEMVTIPSGEVLVGKPTDWPSFGRVVRIRGSRDRFLRTYLLFFSNAAGTTSTARRRCTCTPSPSPSTW